MSEKSNIVQRRIGVFLSYVNVIFLILITMVYTPMVLKYLGDSEYGVHAMASSLIGYLSILDLGMGSTMIRFVSRYRAEGDREKESRLIGTFFKVYLVFGILALVCGLILYTRLDVIFGKSLTDYEMSKLRIVFLIMMVNLSVSFPLGIFGGVVYSHEKIVLRRGIDLIKSIASYGSSIVVLMLGGKSVSLSLSTAIISLTVNLILIWYCFFRIKIEMSFKRLDRGALWDIVRYNFFILLNVIVQELYRDTDKVILGAFSGTVAVTVYNLGMQFYSLLTRLSTAVGNVYLPYISRLVVKKEEGRKEISDQFKSVGRFQFGLLSFAMSGFVCFGRSFIDIWVGAGYQKSYYIALIIMIPSLIPLSQSLGFTILKAENKHAFRSIVFMALAILNVAISIPMAIRFEGIGAAIGTAISCCLGQILTMNIYYSRKLGIDVKGYWREAGKISAVAAGMCLIGAGISTLIDINGIQTLVGAALIYSVIYLGAAWLLILKKEERAKALEICQRFLKR